MKQALALGRRSYFGPVARSIAILAGIVAVAWVVYATGGTRLGYADLGYIPVVVGAYAFGVRGGVVAACVAGLVLGPAMPLDVAAGEAQPISAWAMQLGFFVLAGYVAGMLIRRIRRQAQDIAVLRARNPVAPPTPAGSHGSRARLTRPVAGRRSPVSTALLDDLCAAVSDGHGFALEFQPIVDLASGRCVAAEALVRWHHPEQGKIMPGRFIPLAEQTGLIRPLTDLVIRQALAACLGWRRARIDAHVAINLSARNLREPGLADKLAALAADHGLTPADIELEITETATMSDPEGAAKALGELKRGGHPLAIDDFGTGHSSLAYLKTLPIDTIKIDGAFLRAPQVDPTDAMIVRSTLGLAEGLGLATVAEGIERAEVLHRVRQWGATRAQGHHIAQPMSAEAFAAWMARAAA